MSPALAGRFFTTGPSGKPLYLGSFVLSLKIENVNSPTMGPQDCFGHSVSEETYALKFFFCFSGTETKTGKYCL